MLLRFQADADFDHRIIRGLLLRDEGIDFQTSFDAKLRGVPDPEVLQRTAAMGRVLVSHDTKTMPGHFGEFLQKAASPGLILIPQRYPIGQAVDDLFLIWMTTDSADWHNTLTRLPF